MYEDILDDPEVQEMIAKHEGNHQNDMPLDEFGNPIESDLNEESSDNEEEDKDSPDEKDGNKEEAADLNEDSLGEFVEEVPEIDYSPKTEFSKSIDLSKMEDGFQKYILSRIEPLELTDTEGKVVKVYTADDIPKDFTFADQQAVAKASTELARLEARGDALKKEYDEAIANRENIIAENEKRVAEREGLIEAIENGEFPKLELDEDGNVDSDSKINQLANDVISYQHELNKDRPASRAISFDTALSRFKRDNQERFKELDGSLEKEDEERNNFAKRTARSAQRSGTNSNKSAYDSLSRREFDDLLNDPDFDVRKLL